MCRSTWWFCSPEWGVGLLIASLCVGALVALLMNQIPVGYTSLKFLLGLASLALAYFLMPLLVWLFFTPANPLDNPSIAHDAWVGGRYAFWSACGVNALLAYVRLKSK